MEKQEVYHNDSPESGSLNDISLHNNLSAK